MFDKIINVNETENNSAELTDKYQIIDHYYYYYLLRPKATHNTTSQLQRQKKHNKLKTIIGPYTKIRNYKTNHVASTTCYSLRYMYI